MLEFHVLEGGTNGLPLQGDEGQEQIVALRMPRRLVQLLDAQVEQMNGKYPGVRVTRSSVVRFAIHKLLEAARSENDAQRTHRLG